MVTISLSFGWLVCLEQPSDVEVSLRTYINFSRVCIFHPLMPETTYAGIRSRIYYVCIGSCECYHYARLPRKLLDNYGYRTRAARERFAKIQLVKVIPRRSPIQVLSWPDDA